MKHPCSWPGCPASYIRADYAAEHSRELHLTCTCGRNFTARGMPAHKAGVLRHGLEHPEFPAMPLGAVEAARRARRAERLDGLPLLDTRPPPVEVAPPPLSLRPSFPSA